MPRSFFETDFEHRWAHLPKEDNSPDFQRLWNWKRVLTSVAKQGFQAYEFGIPRPAYDEQGLAGAKLAKRWTLVQDHVHRSHGG
eukprot:symbB.v1.2.007225.t1/scaffold441.1/size205278/12